MTGTNRRNSPQREDSPTFLGNLGKRVWGKTIWFFPTSSELSFFFFFFPTHAMVLRLWLQLWVLEAGMTPKQESVITHLNFYARIFKGLRGWNVPLPHVEKLELSVNTAILSSGWDSLLVLYLGNPQQSGWEWAEEKIIARLVLLCGQAHWLNLTFLPKMEKFGLKSMSKRRRNGS